MSLAGSVSGEPSPWGASLSNGQRLIVGVKLVLVFVYFYLFIF